MYLKCVHPGCSSEFDHTQGRLFRFQQIARGDERPSHWHGVKHYWLCGRHSEEFTIEYQDGLGVVLKARQETVGAGQPGYVVLQEEAAREEVRAIGPDEVEKILEIAIQKGDYASNE